MFLSPVMLARLSAAAFFAAVVAFAALALLALPDTHWLENKLYWRIFLACAVPVLLGFAWAFSQRTVSYLNQAQASARLGEARLLVTLQSCGDGLIVTDEAGRVTMLNPVAEAL